MIVEIALCGEERRLRPDHETATILAIVIARKGINHENE